MDDLQELAEDAPDDETERLIAMHRKQRLQEERRDQARARFGRVYPIGREDYTREVTEASKINEEDDDNEKGTGVVCLLYKDGYVLCIHSPLHLARRFKLGYPGVNARSNTSGPSRNDTLAPNLSPS